MALRARLVTVFAVTALAGGARVRAAQPVPPVALRVQTYPSLVSATALAQTPDGLVWIATRRGLCRHDGARLACFDDEDRWRRTR